MAGHDAELGNLSATEQRLLESAGEVFAEKGFRAATIREIISRARANVAAVNYHFGDKEGLYAAVFRYTRRFCVERFPASDVKDASAEQKLRTFVRAMLHRMLDHGRPTWMWQLMAREMIEPTAVLDEMVENSIKPEFELIASVVCELTGFGKKDVRVRHCVNSIIGQVLFYRHAQAVVTRLHPEQKFDPGDLDELARHISEFSIAAMRSIVGENARPRAL